MEKIILGLLMLKGMSIYEIKSVADVKLSLMCSSSSGSIHSTIKQLLTKGLIGCAPEGKKKVYYITKQGREAFTEWITKPMNHDKAKNIETSKVFFMGMVDPSKIEELIKQYIDSLRDELTTMQGFVNTCTENKVALLEQSNSLVISDCWNEEGIKKNLLGRTLEQTTEDIFTYQMEILQYSVDSVRFEIEWYEEFLKRRTSQNEKS